MTTNLALKGRWPISEAIDGVQCVRVPLGRVGKQGEAIIEVEDWLSLQQRGYSPKLRLNNNKVMTSHRDPGGKSTTVTVASLIARPQDGYRVKFVNGNRLDLRKSNLSTQRGRSSAYRNRINQPDPRKGRMAIATEFIPDDKAQADQWQNQLRDWKKNGGGQYRELPLPTDFEGMSREEILALDEFKKYKLPGLGKEPRTKKRRRKREEVEALDGVLEFIEDDYQEEETEV